MALSCGSVALPLVLLVVALAGGGNAALSRGSFPESFVFGTASSAYQYEGAAFEDGKGASIWDTFTHQHPEKIADQSNGDVAVDSYHRYEEDSNIMKDIGLEAYRFSISWPRILPSGSLSGGINPKGLEYYNNLINDLLSKGIQPYVTLFHWDSPQGLEDKYGGFLNPNIIEDFVDYADVCFREFGDRVQHWITFNEPWTFASQGYASGTFAPGRCTPGYPGLNCSAGDSGTEPYIVVHHQLLAHASAAQLYKQKYQVTQKGAIGITLVSNWYIQYVANSNDNVVGRALDFNLGWCLNPLTFGDYPASMKRLVGNRLPTFSEDESKLVQGSFDFIGINYYTTYYALDAPPSNGPPSYNTDSHLNYTVLRNGSLLGPREGSSNFFYVYPPGIRELLLYVQRKYNNPVIYITENGMAENNNKTLSLKEALNDVDRSQFYYKHLLFLQLAMNEGVDVRGFFAWSLLDNFEWASGYTVRFGINFVDYADGLKRYPKDSANWLKKFLQK